MDFFIAFLALCASAFTSATLLPGTSEAAFSAFFYQFPQYRLAAWLGASLANGLGSLVSYEIGRRFPAKKQPPEKTLRYLNRWGVWLLLFAWIPVVGDALPLAAGWLQLNRLTCTLMLIAGKAARYALLAWGLQTIM